MKIKAVIPVLLLSLLLLLPYSGGCLGLVSGSGNVIEKNLDNTGFNRLEISNVLKVEISQAAGYSININADDNIMDYLVVSQSGETLRLGLKQGYNYRSFTAVASITMPELDRLVMSGATGGTVRGFDSSNDMYIGVSGASYLSVSGLMLDELRIEVSGVGTLEGYLTAGDVEFQVSGASSLTLSGSAENLDASVSGASRMSLDDFAAHDVDISVSGASTAVVNMDGTLDADISGASKLYYIGEPVMGDINVSGASSMDKR
jgi:hypothetical protein